MYFPQDVITAEVIPTFEIVGGPELLEQTPQTNYFSASIPQVIDTEMLKQMILHELFHAQFHRSLYDANTTSED